MRPLALLLLLAFLAAACGGDERSVEDEEFIAELEIPLIPELDEPDVYGQAGFSPNGRNGTRFVIRLDKPFKSPMEALIKRGGCGGFRLGFADYELGEVKDGRLQTDVEAPTRDLRDGYVLVVREPIPKEELERSSERNRVFEKGACADLSSADRVEEE